MSDQPSNVVPFPPSQPDALAVVTDILRVEASTDASPFILALLILVGLDKAGFAVVRA
jgi:hypothetical protein